MKNYSLFVFVCLCFIAHAQDTQHKTSDGFSKMGSTFLNFVANPEDKQRKISAGFKMGPIFFNIDPHTSSPTNQDEYNHWNLELNVEENRFGIGLSARYITPKRSFIKNPFFKPLFLHDTFVVFKVGDLVGMGQNYYYFSFLVTKRLFVINKKHRLDLGIGLQKRTGYVRYFHEWLGGGWEAATDDFQLNKHGLISRVGYTYLIDKHFSISTNVEYSRFKMWPNYFWDFNILGGVRF